MIQKFKLHPVEDEMEKFIEAKFPEYKRFSKDYLEILKDGQGNWKDNIDEKLEFLAMSNFGTLKSINYIRRNIDEIKLSDKNQTFKNIYFHFGLISDCVEDMAKNIFFLGIQLGILNERVKQKSNEARTDYQKFIAKSKISALVSAKISEPYFDIIWSIKGYRNHFTHNPSVDILGYPNDIFIIKEEYLKQFRRWSRQKNELQRSPDKFERPYVRVTTHLDNLIKTLGPLWVEFDKIMLMLKNHPDFIKLNLD